MADGTIRIKAELETKSFDKQIAEVENEIQDLENKKIKLTGQGDWSKEAGEEIDSIDVKVEKLQNKLSGLNASKLKEEMRQAEQNTNNTSKGMNNLSFNAGNAIKKVGKLVLGVFSLRSAYLAVRRASSDLSSYDSQYASNLEYIQFMLTQAIAPVLQYIVGLANTLLQYLGNVLQIWFGINIFSNATAKAFKNMKSSAGATASSVKDIKKQLAGFDEMNILGDTQEGTLGGGGGSSFQMPDFSKALNLYDTIDKIGTGIITKMRNTREETIKLMEDGGIPKSIIKAYSLGSEGAINAFEGIVTFVTGAVEIIDGILTKDSTKIKEGFKDLGIGILEIIGGIFQSIIGIIALLLSVVWEGIKWVVNKIIEFKNNIEKKADEFTSNIENKIINLTINIWNSITEFFTKLWNKVISINASIIKSFVNTFSSIGTFLTDLWNKIISITINVGTAIGTGVSNAFKTVVNAVINWAETKLNSIVNIINNITGKLSGLGVNIPKINRVSLPRLATGAIISQPGRGVNIGGAIAGERGREGILPLTDTQAMQELGETIGKYITINANIINKMNGRVISRELQTINDNRTFAFNS